MRSLHINEEKTTIELAVGILIPLIEAVHVRQTFTYRYGPLALRREEILKIRNGVKTGRLLNYGREANG